MRRALPGRNTTRLVTERLIISAFARTLPLARLWIRKPIATLEAEAAGA